MKNMLYVLSILLMSGCTTQRGTHSTGVVLPGEDPKTIVLPSKNTSRAVISLVEKAREATQQGDYPRAEVLLERTVRIEPRNASLWHYLAKLGLHQARYKEAIGFAKKSSHLARSNPKLKADNWRIIAHARLQVGDVAGAHQAQDRANQISSRP